MNKFFKVSFMAVALSSVAMLTSCDEDPALPDNLASFEADAQGISANETQLTVNLTLSRAADADGAIVVGFVPTGVTYGADFTTEPAAVANKITIPVVAGATAASFKVNKTNTTGLKGDEKVSFTIESVADGLVLGDKATFNLSFSELIATSATMEINGGGAAAYPNRVFVDLSGNRQTGVSRTTWDLGFSSKADVFRVYLNSVNKMVAKVLDKTDLNSVTAADTTGLGVQLSLDAVFGQATSFEDPNDMPDWAKTATAWIDIPTDLTKTAIAAISATDSENKVYIINRGTGLDGKNLGWKKIRVLRNGNGYTLQHADIAATSFTTLNITKNTQTNLNYVSFATGAVTVEPSSLSWDFAWGALTSTTNFGPGTPSIPYFFQDMIITNTAGVEVATYTTNTTTALKTYDTFTEADIAGLTYSTSQTAIGSSWRTTGGPPPSPPAGVTANRFYIVKDMAGNYYKVQFTSLVSATGERTKPSFKFALVKKGA